MSSPPDPAPDPAALRLARDLLSGFHVQDEESGEFLCSIIASGRVPPKEEKELVSMSLMRGVEEWYQLLECAAALENKAHDAEWGVLGHLARISGKSEPAIGSGEPSPAGKKKATRGSKKQSTATPKRKQPGQGVSHFWDDPSGDGTDVTPYRGTAILPIPAAHFHTTVIRPETPTPSSTIPPAQHPKHGQPEPAVTTKHPAISPFFTTAPQPTPKKKPRPPRGTISSLPIPPLSAPHFGLVQETLASDPFALLVAVTFLIRTKGVVSIPLFGELMRRFPGPAALAAADPAEIMELIRPLGLSGVRCGVIQRYARTWLERPPEKGRRFVVKNYPCEGAAKGIKAGEELGAEDEEGAEAVGCAWEIGHFTAGPYALDSWRIFCRDVLLGRAEGWNGEGRDEGFQPEWMRVLPRDKELRACLRWLWMREGFWWDPETGEKEILGDDMRAAVEEGRVGYDETGALVILRDEV